MRFRSARYPHNRNNKGDIVAATTGARSGNLWFAKCLGSEAFGSTEAQALKALKNVMVKQGWRVVK